jgi:hypothetical protein
LLRPFSWVEPRGRDIVGRIAVRGGDDAHVHGMVYDASELPIEWKE